MLALFLSCCNSTKKQENSLDSEIDTFEYVHLIPDSLRTMEQKELLLLYICILFHM